MTDKRWPIEDALARAWVQAPTFEISSIQSSAIADRAIAALKEIAAGEEGFAEELAEVAKRALEMRDD